MRWLREDDGPRLPPRESFPAVDARSGHTYAFQKSDGRVKIGRSATPAARMRSHDLNIQANSSHVIARGWVSDLGHSDASKAEGALKKWCKKHGGRQVLSEWFEDVDFEALVAFAEGWGIDESECTTIPEGETMNALGLLLVRDAATFLGFGRATEALMIAQLVYLSRVQDGKSRLWLDDGPNWQHQPCHWIELAYFLHNRGGVVPNMLGGAPFHVSVPPLDEEEFEDWWLVNKDRDAGKGRKRQRVTLPRACPLHRGDFGCNHPATTEEREAG